MSFILSSICLAQEEQHLVLVKIEPLECWLFMELFYYLVSPAYINKTLIFLLEIYLVCMGEECELL